MEETPTTIYFRASVDGSAGDRVSDKGTRTAGRQPVKMSRRGMTLSEVILALAILVVAVIGIATFVATVHRSVKEGKYQAVGSTIANSELERLRLDSAALADLLATPSLGIKDHLVNIDNFEVRYHQVVTASDLPAMGSRYLRLVSTVSWEQSGRTRQVVLETCYPKP